MSKVKKRKSGKSTRKAASRKTRRRSVKNKRAPRKSFAEAVSESSRRLAFAATAGFAVIAVAIVAVLWASGYFGLMAERAGRAVSAGVASAGFEIRRVTVKGRGQTPTDDLQDALGPVMGDSLLHFDPYRARARIEELGWVRSAAVSRLWPDTVQVSIREREPAAVWQLSGALYLVDQEGAVIREIGAYEYSQLPLIVGAGAPEAASGLLLALRETPGISEKLAALVRVSGRRWNLRFQTGLDVKLPETGFEEAIRDLAALDAAHGTLDQPLEYIDFRDSERVIFRRRGDGGETEGPARPVQ